MYIRRVSGRLGKLRPAVPEPTLRPADVASLSGDNVIGLGERAASPFRDRSKKIAPRTRATNVKPANVMRAMHIHHGERSHDTC